MGIGQSYILGGVSAPQFVLLGEQLCPNGDFENDATGWAGCDGGTIARVADPYSIWSGYSLEVEDNSAVAYEGAECDVELVRGARYYVSVWVRRHALNNSLAWVDLYDINDNDIGAAWWSQATFSALGDEQYSLLTFLSNTCNNAGTGHMRVWPASHALAGTGKAYFCHARLWRVREVLTLTSYVASSQVGVAQRTAQVEQYFDPIATYSHNNLSGKLTRQVRRWRYGANVLWPLVRGLDNVLLRRLSSERAFVFWPHYEPANKVFFSVLVRSAGPTFGGYPQSGGGDRYGGHVVPFAMRGVEPLASMPFERV